MAYELPKILSVSGRTITIDHLELPANPKTVLTADAAAGATSLTVLDNAGFSNAYPLLIGVLGSDKTEIKKVNAAVTAGTALTVTTTTFSHSVGTPVQRLIFNQFKIYGTSTTTFSSANLVATVDMEVSSPFTTYVNTGTEYTYYWVVPFDSFNSVTGDNSDYVAASTGYSESTVGYVIEAALKDAKAKKSTDLNGDKLIGEVNSCLRFMHGKLKHWSALETFNYALGAATRGTFSYSMPSDISDSNSNKAILDIRVGSDTGLIYKDKKELEGIKEDVIQTTVRTQALANDTTLAITNSYDFADSGTVNVYVSGTKYSITYTGVTRSATTGVLTGVPASGTGSISVTIAAGTNVFQGESEGQPIYFTAYDGVIEVWPMPDANYDNQNIWLDYFTSKIDVNSYGDALSGFRFDAVKHWLIWKIRAFTSSSTGSLNMQDGDFLMFNQILKDQIRLESSGQKFKWKPKINFINYGKIAPPQNSV